MNALFLPLIILLYLAKMLVLEPTQKLLWHWKVYRSSWAFQLWWKRTFALVDLVLLYFVWEHTGSLGLTFLVFAAKMILKGGLAYYKHKTSDYFLISDTTLFEHQQVSKKKK